MRIRYLLLAMPARAVWPQTAGADLRAVSAVAAPFAEEMTARDAELAQARGGYVGNPWLTKGIMVAIVDTQTRADFRESAAIGRATMDIWWGSTGAEMIAANVRTALP